MNICPIAKTSFKGYINIKNPQDDQTIKARFFERSKRTGRIRELSEDEFSINGEQSAPAACYRNARNTEINTDCIKYISPDKIYIENSIGQYGVIDISKADYNKVLTAYTAASQNPEVLVIV